MLRQKYVTHKIKTLVCMGCFWSCASIGWATAYDIPFGTTSTDTVVMSSSDTLTIEGTINSGAGTSFYHGAVYNNVYSTDCTVTISETGVVSGPFNTTIMLGYGSGSTVVNAGLVESTSGGEAVLLGQSSNTHLTNSGTISTTGYSLDMAYINSFAVVNSGTITGANAFNNSNNGTILNTGTLISSTSGIAIDGTDSTNIAITNSGTIDGGIILNTGDSLNNTGIINAGDSASQAIAVYGDSVTVSLGPTSQVVGIIFADSGATNARISIYSPPGMNGGYQIVGPWHITRFYTGEILGTQETADKILFQRVAWVNDSLSGRLSMPKDYATWAVAYGGHSSRSLDDTMPIAPAYKLNDGGVTAGTTLPLSKTPIDFVLNYHVNHINIANTTQVINAHSMLTGFVMPNIVEFEDNGVLSGKLLVGYVKHRGERGALHSTFHSLLGIIGGESSWKTSVRRTQQWKLTVGLDVAAEHYKPYTEGATYVWDSRTLTQASGYVDVSTIHTPLHDQFSIWGGVRLMEQVLLSGRSYSYVYSGVSGEYDQAYYVDTHGRVQVGLSYSLFDGAKCTASADYTKSRHHIKKYQGYLGVVFEN
ncbi:MAG: hypothetical protein V4490_00815 [Pseudomonadota bacterium]